MIAPPKTPIIALIWLASFWLVAGCANAAITYPQSATLPSLSPAQPTPAPKTPASAPPTSTPTMPNLLGAQQNVVNTSTLHPGAPARTPTVQLASVESDQVKRLLKDLGPAPAFDTLTWVNREPISLGDLQGRVVMIEFWSYG